MRRSLLAGLAILALGACSATTPPPPADPSTTSEPTAAAPSSPTTPAVPDTPAPSSPEASVATALPIGITCLGMAQDLPLAAQVGQLYMVGVSTGGLDAGARKAISKLDVGAVVLLGNTDAGAAAIADLTAEIQALAPTELPIVVAVDQEGGTVQRLKGPGFSDMPSAVTQGKLPAGELRPLAEGWGKELSAAGVHWDLAPVADVVPAAKQRSNAPIGKLRRNFGNDVPGVSRSVVEFVGGMTDAGVATSLKHFPGLGHVVENTDFDAATDTHVGPGDPGWKAFTDGIGAGASSVMVSSAVFTQLDPDHEAVFSSRVITEILRGELGFDGVVIADDLGAAAAVADVPPADRGVRFIAAGGDVVINADPAIMEAMWQATVTKADADPAFGARVVESATRVLQLKAELGLVSCQ